MSDEKVGNCKPPREYQFSATRRPGDLPNHNKNRPKQYLTPLLKKFLSKEINYQDPETQKIIRGRVKDAIVWRLILNGSEGETNAIKEIFDRLEGKLLQKSGADIEVGVNVTVMPIIKVSDQKQEKELEFNIGTRTA